MGDLNGPLQVSNPSFGTKLLYDWEATGQVTILNNKHTHTRFDPSTGKGSTLDVGVISVNLKANLLEFKVDVNKEWTPFSMSKQECILYVFQRPTLSSLCHHIQPKQIFNKYRFCTDHRMIKVDIYFQCQTSLEYYKLIAVKYLEPIIGPNRVQ